MKIRSKFKMVFLACLVCLVFSCKNSDTNNTSSEGTEYNAADGTTSDDMSTSPGSNADDTGTMQDTLTGTGTGAGTGTSGSGTSTNTP